MVLNVMNAYKIRIIKLDWMSEPTKQKALQKLAAVKMKVGYPNTWKDFSAMQISRKSYCDNMLSVNLWWHNYEIAKLNKPVDREEWDMTPQTYNAYYNPSNNEIVLPAGIFLIPGIKDAEADDAMVYGYAGASTIGHEITHGFDDEGRQFDEKGNLNNWWTTEDELKFKAKSQRLVEQFNNFEVNGMSVNGEATLGENIADLGGIRLGLDAFMQTQSYKENKMIGGYTPLQRFFLGYALGWMYHHTKEYMSEKILTDVHAPTHLRINAPFANIPEFYEAFHVLPTNKMYIPDSARVKIW
jgi:putative endopeptidase